MALSILAAVLTSTGGRLSDRNRPAHGDCGRCTLATALAGSIAVFGTMPSGAVPDPVGAFSGFALTLYSLAISHVNDKLEPAQTSRPAARCCD